jgi:hypothetical protein
MADQSSFAPPSIELLRALAAEQGVDPSGADLEAVVGFLRVILPGLADIERRLPQETPQA